MKNTSVYCWVITALSFSLPAFAQSNDAAGLDDISLEDLLNITIISAAKIEQKSQDAPATIRVISQAQIKQRGYQNLDDALKDIPGIDLVGVGGAYPYIHTIRGSYGDENRRLLLMVDGIVENSLNGSFEMAGAAYSLHHIERIEIIFGPASALYGANAYSGIINIITKQGEDYRGVETSVGTGSFSTKMANIYLNFAKKSTTGTIDGSLAASWLDSRGEKYANRHPQFSSNYLDNGYSIVARLRYQTLTSSTTLGTQIYDMPMGIGTFGNANTQYFDLPMASTLNPGEGGYIQHEVNGADSSLWHSYFSTTFVQNDLQINERWALFSRLQWRETGLADDSFSYSRSGNNFFHFIGQHQSDGLGAEIQTSYHGEYGQRLIVGFQYQHLDLERGYRPMALDTNVTVIDGLPILNVHGSFLPRQGVAEINRGYYLQGIYPSRFIGDTDFTLGIRYDENSLYGSSFTPRMGAVNRWSDKLTFKLLYSQAFRAPTPFELFGASGVRLANPNLAPETVDSYEFSANYINGDLQLITSFFYNDMDNVIVEGVPVLGTNKFQVQNIGTAKVKGLEQEAIYFVNPKLKVFANLSYQRAVQNVGQGNVDIPNVARLKANLNINYQLNDNNNINLGINWLGSRTVQPSNPLPSVAGYVIAKVTWSKPRFIWKNLTMQFNINNLFDRNYHDPGIKFADGQQWGTIHEQPGRHALLTLTYKG